jgi:hypothetical protein
MSMTQMQLRRLEKLEAFVERLKLGSYIAKAAGDDGENTRVLGNTARLRDVGEQVLAKAATTYDTPDTLMAAGERAISDPTQMGVFASHLSTGDLAAARKMFGQASDRAAFVKGVDAAEDLLNAPLGDFDNRRAASELTARFASVERLLASIEARLDQLERRPQAAPVQPGEQVVVKAQGRSAPMSRGQRANDLLRRIDAYIDSPSLTGQLSSLVQQGHFDEVENALQHAEAAHDAQRLREERKSWTR